MRLHRPTASRAAYWTSAATVGLLAAAYAKLIAVAQGTYFSVYAAHPWLVTACTPLMFLAASFAVVRFAPHARGSGIPQVLEVIDEAKADPEGTWGNERISWRTALLKIVSSFLGVLGGASIGREGPTVQIASSVFAGIGRRFRLVAPKLDLHAMLVAGGAAGVAAAFNTPLAGIAFALEEIAEGSFAPFKRQAVLSVIIAGITAQAIAGNYLYFGHPELAAAPWTMIGEAIVIGIACGLFGGLFGWLLAHPPKVLTQVKWYVRSLVCGSACALTTLATDGATAGSGYEHTRQLMDAAQPTASALFPFAKILTTVLSYYSGMAGGIFSPSLAMGSGAGMAIATVAHLPDVKAMGLMGMVGFFSGAIQAPLTGVIIVMEMTDEHALIIPFLVAAFVAQRMGQVFLDQPLYRYLAFRNKEG